MPPLRAEVRELLEARNFAHLATTLPDGSPHSVPVWIGVEGDHVVFFTQPGSRKARNLERNPRVAISLVDLENPYRSAQLRSRVVGTVEGEEALEIIDRLAVKYTASRSRCEAASSSSSSPSAPARRSCPSGTRISEVAARASVRGSRGALSAS